MQRLTRLTALLTLLQSQKKLKAQDLAERFDVSVRTIYGDICTLQDAGVPVGGDAGVGYYMVEGYTMPPVAFTSREANALLAVGALVHQQSDRSLKESHDAALDKIQVVLKATQQDQTEALEIRQDSSKVRREKHEAHLLMSIQEAINEYHLIEMEYLSQYKGEYTRRTVEPLGLYFTEAHWVMVAFCQLRQANRDFRLDRIHNMQVTNVTFNYRPFHLKAYFQSIG